MASPPEREAYMLKRDKEESNRLDLQHVWMKSVVSNHLIHPSIPLGPVRAVADVATGTGAWLRDVAASWPKSTSQMPDFVGFDISADQFPTHEGETIQFCVHDATRPFPEEYLGRFDVVNIRLVSYAIKEHDLPSLVRNVAAILRPGGYLNWIECDVLDSWAEPETSKARAVLRTVINARINRGLTPAIVTPLVRVISSSTALIPAGQVNPMSWTGDELRIMQLQSISTKNHREAVVRESTSPIIKRTICALLRSGGERLNMPKSHDGSTQDSQKSMTVQEVSEIITALERGDDDLGASIWNCEVTWIVARKAVVTADDGNWMVARYGEMS